MGDTFKVGDLKNVQGLAIGKGATATVNYILPLPRPDAASNLPPFNPNFTGRNEHLNAIAVAFGNAPAAAHNTPLVVTQAISGMGGVGKTQLALAYAHIHQDKYDIIWRLAADDSAELDNSLRGLGETLELPVTGKDAPTVRNIVLSHLSGGGKEVLLIYDNADAIEPRLLQNYLPNGCHLLITSRRNDSQWRGMAEPLTLGIFTDAEAMAFWQRRMGGVTEVGLLAKARLLALEKARLLALAEALGHLPLAMEQAAAFMVEEQMNAADYLQAFTQERDALWARESAPDSYHATVATTWKMAFDHAKQTEGAAALLNLLSFFAPDEIPLDVVWAGADRLPDSLAAVAADKWKRRDSLKALRTYSLLTVTDGKAAMHRLVQDVARRQMGEGELGGEGEGAKVWVDAAMKVLYKEYNFDQHDMGTWAACGQLLPHLIAAVELAAGLAVESTEAAYLNYAVGGYLEQYGDFKGALPYRKRDLAISEELFGSDHKDTATGLNNLAGLHESLGEYEKALPMYRRVVEIYEDKLGEDHAWTAVSLNNLGELLRVMGKYEEARPFYDRALAITEKQLGSDHPDTAISLNNLGLLLQDMGKYGEARPFYDRALAIWEKQLGSDHPQIATGLNNLAWLTYDEGDMQEAAQLMRRALAIFEKALGNDHPNTQTVRQSLATIEAALV